MEIDIYDFDKTIIPFDSGSRFTLYCALHYPWIVFTLPLTGIALVLALSGVITFDRFKKICFLFVPLIPIDKAVHGFWKKNLRRQFDWVKEKNRYRVIISASPDFLLEPIYRELGFDELICTRHNSKTGAIIGRNCRGEEKVRRFYEIHPEKETKVIDVYSDSLSADKPIFSLATNKCYNIVEGERVPFDFKEKYGE